MNHSQFHETDLKAKNISTKMEEKKSNKKTITKGNR